MKLRWKLGLTWLAIELATLPFAVPAFATFIDRVSFSVPQKAMTLSHEISPGQQSFIVASNAPFAVVSAGAALDMDITVSLTGDMSGLKFGGKAQMPGAANACATPSNGQPARIYTAAQKTAQRRGSPIEQAVLVTVKYDPDFSPKLKIMTIDAATESGALLAFPCGGIL